MCVKFLYMTTGNTKNQLSVTYIPIIEPTVNPTVITFCVESAFIKL